MSAETRSLTDDVIAITGATSGIGAATARQLVEAGAKVVIGARHGDRLDGLVAELGPEHAVAVVSDVRIPGDSAKLVAAARERFGKLTDSSRTLASAPTAASSTMTTSCLTRMIETNFSGTVWAVRPAVPALSRAGWWGRRGSSRSVAGLRGNGDEAVYAGTKFAQLGLAGSLDRELRPKGIRVTAICPAGVATEFAMGTGRTPGMPELASFLDPDDVAFAVTTTLRQPRRLRTTLWALWSNGQSS